MALADLLRVGGQRSLCVIDPKADLAAAAQLAEAMIPVNPDSKEPPWGEFARSLLAAVFIWHQLHPEKE